MATDYLNRMYWPKRGPEAGGEARTTYGKTIALTAHLRRQNELGQKWTPDQPDSFGDQIQHTPQRAGSRMLHRRLPNLSQSAPEDYLAKYDDKYRYTMNRVRGIQSQVPLSEIMDPTSQQISLRGTPGTDARTGKPLEDYRLRLGRAGGVWKHVKEVLQGRGNNIMYVDGERGIEENRPTRRRQLHVTSRHSMPEFSTTSKPPTGLGATYPRNNPLMSTDEYRGIESANWNVMR